MSESKPITPEIPAGGMGPHVAVLQEAAGTGTTPQPDGGMGPHVVTTSTGPGDPITPDGGMGPH